MGSPGNITPPDPPRRYLACGLIALAGILLTALAVAYDWRQTQETMRRQLVWRADNEAMRFQRSLDRSLEVVDALASFLAASREVEREEFRLFAAGPLARHPEFYALQWLPKVDSPGRAAFETRLAEATPTARITERDGAGGLQQAGERATYFPILLVEPLNGNEKVLGLDAYSRAGMRPSMDLARDSGEMVVSEPIALVQTDGRRQGVAVYRPVYRRDAPTATVADRRAAHGGFAVGILIIAEILTSALKGSQPTGLDVIILDRSGRQPQVLHAHASRARGPGAPPPTLTEMLSGVHHVVPLQVPGRHWEMLFRPSPAFQREFHNHRWFWIMLLGLSLTGAMVAHQLRRQSSSAALASLNDALQHSNEALTRHSLRLGQAQRLANLGIWELTLDSDPATWAERALACLEQAQTTADRPMTVHPEDRPRVLEALDALCMGRSANLDLIHRSAPEAGAVRLVHQRAEIAFDDADRPVRIYGASLDITDSVRQSERLRLAARVIESTHEAVVITDREARIIEVNPAFCRITGYSAAETVGRKPGFWKSQHHDKTFYTRLWEALRTEGFWQGEIWNQRANGDVFPTWQTISAVRDEHGEITHYVSVFTDISELVESRSQLLHLAQHDALTDLPNRLLYLDRLRHALERARREQQRLAVLFLDLDRFKHINDSLGHALGDRLLVEVALRLRSTVRSEDTVARMGGDEFILLMENLRQDEDAALLAQKLLQVMSAPFHLEGHEFYITSSIGISLYPRDGTDAETLVRNADAAMYRAKAQGRNAYAFYTEALTHSAMERVQIETELRQAIARGELAVHYQPQVDLASGRVIGAEALLRWQHPRLGMVSPERFIPIAEDTGLIIDIGAWVLHQACRQMQSWRQAGLPLDSIAVNVAGPQIQRGDILATVQRVLAETGLPAHCLELEVTEGFIMGQAEAAIGVLDALSRLGVRLAIDDFGTGYSSLAYLKRLPIDKLKVDRSFVRDLPADEEDAAIAAAVIALGHSLGLTVIAEGVETAAQRDFLLTRRCDQAQGWYYGRPVPPEHFPGTQDQALAA